jgi:hypothetical protein
MTDARAAFQPYMLCIIGETALLSLSGSKQETRAEETFEIVRSHL